MVSLGHIRVQMVYVERLHRALDSVEKESSLRIERIPAALARSRVESITSLLCRRRNVEREFYPPVTVLGCYKLFTVILHPSRALVGKRVILLVSARDDLNTVNSHGVYNYAALQNLCSLAYLFSYKGHFAISFQF